MAKNQFIQYFVRSQRSIGELPTTHKEPASPLALRFPQPSALLVQRIQYLSSHQAQLSVAEDECARSRPKRGAGAASAFALQDVARILLIVADEPRLAVADVHLPLLGTVERAGADPPEDADLIAGFVHGPVAVQAARHREHLAVRRPICRNEARRRADAEALVAGGFGGCQLDDAPAVKV